MYFLCFNLVILLNCCIATDCKQHPILTTTKNYQMKNNQHSIFKAFSSPIMSSRLYYNFVYFLYCLYELRFGKILLNNYGYFPSSISDENAYQLQFYLELMSVGEITQNDALNLCEIGCGQGHGALFLLRNYLNHQSHFTGLDASEVAISYCKWKYRKLKNAAFKLNRHNLPFADESFDVFLSVETGVPRSSEALQDICRCLKPSGLFIFYETYEEQNADKLLSCNGFEIIRKINVTSNIVQALIHDNNRKQTHLDKLWFLPKKVLAFLNNYTAMQGSSKFEAYQGHKRNGFIYALRKIQGFQLPNLLIGYIDSWDGHALKGWAFCTHQTAPIKLQIRVNGIVMAETMADLPRKDVAAVHGKKRIKSGFSIALPSITKNGFYNVQVMNTQADQEMSLKPFIITS